jgi:predicted outer membrane repeat protein
MLRAALVLLLLVCARIAHADSTVDRCGSDIESGAGTNLATALAAGGRITFSCGGGATINVNCSHALSADTEIDGGSTVTLRGNPGTPGCGGLASAYSMFANASPTRRALQLRNLRIVEARPKPDGGVTNLVGGNVARGNLDLRLSGVTIANSYAPVALDAGKVFVERSEFSGNEREVIVAPDITIADGTTFLSNQAAPLVADGGNVSIADSLFNGNLRPSDFTACSFVDIRGTQFVGNSGPEEGGALTVNCNSRIAHSEFAKNSAKTGGAIYIDDLAAHTNLIDVDFDGNVASKSGGAIALRFEIFAPAPPAQALELHHVTFKNNKARVAGAISFGRGALPGLSLNARKLSAAGSRFIDNEATMFGGALFVSRADASLSRSFFSGNRAVTAGGAIVGLQAGDASVEISNSLLVRNVAPSGAAFVGEATTFINSTIADNDGPGVSGIASSVLVPLVGGPVGPQPIRLSNTILSGGTASACGAADAAAPIEDTGNNLQYPGTSCAASISVGAPNFGPSYIPLPTSPAANEGNDAVCAASPIAGRDIWDTVRPKRERCTIGAAEADLQTLVDHALSPLTTIVSRFFDCACSRAPSR